VTPLGTAQLQVVVFVKVRIVCPPDEVDVGKQSGMGEVEIVLVAMFAELVEFVLVRAKTLKLYEVPFVNPVMLAVVCPETKKELL
jgi:hypothetical protein